MPQDNWGPTPEQPLRGRSSEELKILQDLRATGICHGCQHVLERHNRDWGCVRGCRCVMVGCVPMKTDFWEDNVRRDGSLTNAEADYYCQLDATEQARD